MRSQDNVSGRDKKNHRWHACVHDPQEEQTTKPGAYSYTSKYVESSPLSSDPLPDAIHSSFLAKTTNIRNIPTQRRTQWVPPVQDVSHESCLTRTSHLERIRFRGMLGFLLLVLPVLVLVPLILLVLVLVHLLLL